MNTHQILTALKIDPEPKTFEEYVTAWDQIGEVMRTLKDLEMDMRKRITAHAFPTPTEGTNTATLADGRKLKLSHKITRSVDEAAIQTARQAYELVNDRPVPFDELLKVKYDLATTPFRKLEVGSAAYLAVAHMITAKPGAPALEVK